MTTNSYHDIEKLEADLWSAADNLRANSKLTSSDYFMPVLGIIVLRHAANRFATATRQIEEDQASGKMPPRKVMSADYVRRRALWLPEPALRRTREFPVYPDGRANRDLETQDKGSPRCSRPPTTAFNERGHGCLGIPVTIEEWVCRTILID
jgi:hypothetical protein